jgi:hypothetical protein
MFSAKLCVSWHLSRVRMGMEGVRTKAFMGASISRALLYISYYPGLCKIRFHDIPVSHTLGIHTHTHTHTQVEE